MSEEWFKKLGNTTPAFEAWWLGGYGAPPALEPAGPSGNRAISRDELDEYWIKKGFAWHGWAAGYPAAILDALEKNLESMRSLDERLAGVRAAYERVSPGLGKNVVDIAKNALATGAFLVGDVRKAYEPSSGALLIQIGHSAVEMRVEAEKLV